MPIVDGQLVNAAVTNAAFLYKDSNDYTNATLGIGTIYETNYQLVLGSSSSAGCRLKLKASQSPSGNPLVEFNNSIDGFTSYIGQENSAGGGSGFFGGDSSAMCIRADTGKNINFLIFNSVKVRINSSGNMGIGLSPSYRLDVDSGATSNVARFNSSSTTSAKILMASNGSARSEWVASSADLFRVNDSGGTEKLSLSGSTGVLALAQGLVVGGNTTGDSNYGTISSVQSTRNYRGSFTATFTGSTTNFASTQTITVNYVRQNDLVTLTIPGKTATCGSGSVVGLTSDAIPSNIRPSTTFEQPIFITNNGSLVTTPGDGIVNTAGVITIQRDVTATAFTASTTCGWKPFNVSYVL